MEKSVKDFYAGERCIIYTTGDSELIFFEYRIHAMPVRTNEPMLFSCHTYFTTVYSSRLQHFSNSTFFHFSICSFLCAELENSFILQALKEYQVLCYKLLSSKKDSSLRVYTRWYIFYLFINLISFLQ